jgi:hypothetical protein
MNTIFVSKEKLETREKQKEQCLEFLYYVEDIFDYNYEIISKCIDELQKLEFKEDKREEV